MRKKYDMTKIESIYEYALQMQNQKISDIVKEAGKKESADKGEIGNLIQECYFGIPRNPSIVKPQIISGDFRRLYKVEIPVTVCG